MNEQQIEWWKEASVDIMERQRLTREGASGGASDTHVAVGDDGDDGPTPV
jgi:hypothetical protein